MAANRIPARKDVPSKDKWDLSTIYKSDTEWEKSLKTIPEFSKKVLEYKGKLGNSSENLVNALKKLEKTMLEIENVVHYASLQHESDEDDTTYSDRYGRAMMAYTALSTELSFIDPEIQTINEKTLLEWIEKPEFSDYKIYIKKLLHFKKYILSEKEERILSLQGETAQTADTVFSVLTNVDMNKTFGTVTEE